MIPNIQTQTQPIIFYSRPGCHLCEDGQWILEVALRERDIAVTYIDISDDDLLTEVYGSRIPVLKHPQQSTELNWPFTPETILAWLDDELQV